MSYVLAKYIRLSIEDAKTESLSIENQRLVIDRYIDELDIPDIDVLEFIDNGYTGTHFERPAIQELLELVRTGKVNCIVVKDFTRFGRNMIETGYFLQRVFPLFRTRFIALTDGYDSDDYIGDTGGLDVLFKLMLSERYSRDISKKIKASRQVKAQRGEAVSKNCIFGYKKVDKHLEIDEPAAETIRLIFDLAANGKKLTEIAASLYTEKRPTPSEYRSSEGDSSSRWSIPVLHSIIHDEQYIGTYTAGKTKRLEVGSRKTVRIDEPNWIKIPDFHPAIVDKTVYKLAQENISKKREPVRKREVGTSERYNSIERPLKGKVVCGCCGHRLKISSTRNAVFSCQFSSIPDAQCRSLRIAESDLAHKLLETMRNQLQVLGSFTQTTEKHIQSEPELNQLITAGKKEKQVLYERFVRGEIDVDEYKSAKNLNSTEIDRLSHILSTLTAEASKRTATLCTNKQLHEITERAFRENTLSCQLVDMLIDKVVVFPDGNVNVTWKAQAPNSLLVDRHNVTVR